MRYSYDGALFKLTLTQCQVNLFVNMPNKVAKPSGPIGSAHKGCKSKSNLW